MFLILSDSENTRDILLTAKDAGMFNGEYAIFTVDLLLKHDHDSETYEHGLRGDELSQQGKDLSFWEIRKIQTEQKLIKLYCLD